MAIATGTAIMMGIAALGTGAQVMGQIKANKGAAEAEKQNAAFYAEQAKFAQAAGERAEDIFKRETNEFLGNQTSAFAKAGVDLSGSALVALMDTHEKAKAEIGAIRTERDLNVKTAKLRGQAAIQNADRYTNFWNNALPATGTILTNAAHTYGAMK